MYIYIYIYIYTCRYVYVHVDAPGFLRNKHSVCASPSPAVQQQKPLSRPRFGALKANIPMCIIFRRNVVFLRTPVVAV